MLWCPWTLGAMVVKPPPLYPLETLAQDGTYLEKLLPGEDGTERCLMAIFSNYVGQSVTDRGGASDRTSLVASARDRIRTLVGSARTLRPPLAEVPLRGFEELWQRCDGDIIEVMERCRLSFRQCMWVAQIMCDYRDEQASKGGSYPSIFPTGEEGSMLEKSMVPGQLEIYRKLRRDYEADLARKRGHRVGKEELKVKRKEATTLPPAF